MSDLPESDFKPEDVDALIRDYGVPLDPERRQSLLMKLRAAETEIKSSTEPTIDLERHSGDHDRE